MSSVRGRIKNGTIQLEGPLPAEWEGAEVETYLARPTAKWGISDEDWPTTLEGIARLLEQMDAAEPLDMTPEETEAFDRALAEQRAWQKTQFDRWTSEAEGAAR